MGSWCPTLTLLSMVCVIVTDGFCPVGFPVVIVPFGGAQAYDNPHILAEHEADIDVEMHEAPGELTTGTEEGLNPKDTLDRSKSLCRIFLYNEGRSIEFSPADGIPTGYQNHPWASISCPWFYK